MGNAPYQVYVIKFKCTKMNKEYARNVLKIV